MKEFVIMSGKGGTGKTFISSSLVARIGEEAVICDCDVETPNLHILLEPAVLLREDFYGSEKSEITPDICIDCGACADMCRFGAIADSRVDPLLCEGCGLCREVCPAGAVAMKPHVCGEWYRSESRYGPFFHARLGIGEQNSGKLVALLRQKAREYARKQKIEWLITDGPPGIGCPAIATLSGADFGIIVTEPSAAAIHDMERLFEVFNHFGTRFGIVINRYDVNPDLTRDIEELCRMRDIDLMGKFPFSPAIPTAINQGAPPSVVSNQVAGFIGEIWERAKESII